MEHENSPPEDKNGDSNDIEMKDRTDESKKLFKFNGIFIICIVKLTSTPAEG